MVLASAHEEALVATPSKRDICPRRLFEQEHEPRSPQGRVVLTLYLTQVPTAHMLVMRV